MEKEINECDELDISFQEQNNIDMDILLQDNLDYDDFKKIELDEWIRGGLWQ